MQEVFIVSAVRTPIGSFGGHFAGVSATQLGAAAIRGALEKAGVSADQVNEVLMGNVVSANLGQAPARQAARYAGIPDDVPCTTVNKVCASGIKCITLGAQFQLNLGNLSATNEDWTYGLVAVAANNPHGAVIKLNGAPLNYSVPT